MLGVNFAENWLDGVSPPPRETFLPMHAPRHLHARRLHEHWSERQDAFVIGRDIPSRALAPVLRNVAVLEANDDHTDFNVRLAGTAWLRRFGYDVTGTMLSQLYDRETFAGRRQLLWTLLKDGAPVFRDVKLMDAGGYVCALEPANQWETPRKKLREEGRLRFLEPGEEVKYHVEWCPLCRE
jgi:hypothetical protein